MQTYQTKPEQIEMNLPIVIFGAKEWGRVALDIFRSHDLLVYCFLDDDASLHNQNIDEITVMGSTDSEEILKIIGKDCDAFIAVQHRKEKEHLIKHLQQKRKKAPINAIHASAVVEPSANLGIGNLIGARAVIGTQVYLGNHAIISAGAVVDYETQIGDFVQIGTGSIICPKVKIGEGAFIGSGVTIVSGVKIGKNASVGAGSLVVKDVGEGETVFGVPAQKVTV